MISVMNALKGGTCIKNGADKFMQYLAPDCDASFAAKRMESVDTVMKKPALYIIFAS